MINEANEPSSACRLWRVFQVETSTPPNRRFNMADPCQRIKQWMKRQPSAPNTRPPEQLVPNPTTGIRQLKLLWLSSDNKDDLIRISQGIHACLKEKQVPHVCTRTATATTRRTGGTTYGCSHNDSSSRT